MKTITVRLPAAVVNDIAAESRSRRISKSDVVRERLAAPRRAIRARPASFEAIADLVGSVDELPSDLSSHRKEHLKKMRYGRARHR